MENFNNTKRRNKKFSEIRTFSVPLNREEKQERLTVDNNFSSKSYKEELISKALKLHSQGNIKEAKKYYQSIIKKGFSDPKVFANYGVILKGLGKLQEAEQSYRQALKINPNFAEAHSNLGSVLKGLGKLQEAELSFSEAIKIKPDYAIAHYNLGNVLGDLGKLKEAEKSYQKAIEIKSDFALAHYNLGMILINLGNSYEGELSLRKAIEIDPNLTCAVEQLARHLYLNEKFNLAIEYLSKSKSDSCQSLYLSCLLCLDKEKEFYKKYNEISQQKICNADMSGIIEHANIIYETRNDSYFCNEAIKYIFKEKINEELFSAAHFDQLISYLKSDELKTKPQALIYKASQSTGNLFLLNYPFIKSLKKALEVKIELYKARFKDSKQGFIENWPKEYTLRSWILSMKTGGFIKPHNHRYGWITGSFYLQVPKCNNNDNSGNISFSYQGPEYPTKGKKFDATIKKIDNRDICIFPSSLFHHTIPFKSTEERICLVFDLAKKS